VTTFKPIRKRLLSKEVEQQLRQAIVTGVYRPGDRLPSERELSEQFKISRATVREALRHLQSNGLILIKRGVDAGAYVSELEPGPIIESFSNLIRLGKVNFAHLMHARLYIEPPATRVAAVIRRSEDIENLTKLLDEAERSVNYSPGKARLICTRFHCEVTRILQNPIIDFVCESITQNYSSVLIEMSKTKLTKDDILELIETHRDILDSIVKKEPSRAYEKARNHIFDTYSMYSQMFPAADNKNIEDCMKLF
jgi:GntR family transcriptional repressor for pyruvate dehydrogenase complex